MEIFLEYKPGFIREFKKFSKPLQEDALGAIERFRDSNNHHSLHTHKLHGKFKNCFSFSMNYRYRIIFQWRNKEKGFVELLDIGDHDLYE